MAVSERQEPACLVLHWLDVMIGQEEGPAGARTRIWGYLACAWCAIFAAVHLYWATGGDVGLASSAGTELATRRPWSFVAAGLWGTALLLLMGAVFSAGLAHWRLRGGRRGTAFVSWLAGIVLVARGLLVEVVLLTGAGGVASSVGSLETHWSLVLWDPWFIAGGLLLLLAARQFQRG
jgi:Protein of unknown function (DUF3995)